MDDRPTSDLELDLWLQIQAGDFDGAFAGATRLLMISDDPVQRGRVEAARRRRSARSRRSPRGIRRRAGNWIGEELKRR